MDNTVQILQHYIVNLAKHPGILSNLEHPIFILKHLGEHPRTSNSLIDAMRPDRRQPQKNNWLKSNTCYLARPYIEKPLSAMTKALEAERASHCLVILIKAGQPSSSQSYLRAF